MHVSEQLKDKHRNGPFLSFTNISAAVQRPHVSEDLGGQVKDCIVNKVWQHGRQHIDTIMFGSTDYRMCKDRLDKLCCLMQESNTGKGTYDKQLIGQANRLWTQRQHATKGDMCVTDLVMISPNSLIM